MENPEKTKTITRFLERACLGYNDRDDPASWARAAEMLDEAPWLAVADVFTAAATGNLNGLRNIVAADATLVQTQGGPFDWEPLMYLTYSRVTWSGIDQDFLASAAYLLEQGANPNSFFLWDDTYKFTALTGALGNGEKGLEKQPPHPDSWQLARLLLKAGADPNDGQALYNWMQTPGNKCLELMLEYGLNPSHQINWKTTRTIATLDYQLQYAVDSNDAHRARLLLKRGANANHCAESGHSLYRAAIRQGHGPMAQILVDAGAEPKAQVVDRFLGACLTEDRDQLNEILESQPDFLQGLTPLDRDVLHQVCSRNLLDSAAFLLELGFGVNSRETAGYGHTPCHKAALNGHLPMARFLVEKGADLELRDLIYKDTPAGWARHYGHGKLAEYLDGVSTKQG